MKDWSDNDVSPYLLRPLRSYAQAVEDLRRRDTALQEARRMSRRGQLIPFPGWRRKNRAWRMIVRRGLRHPA